MFSSIFNYYCIFQLWYELKTILLSFKNDRKKSTNRTKKVENLN